jgi:hypothetical protein
VTTTVVHVRDGYQVYIGRAVPRRKFKASKWGNPYKVVPGRSSVETALLFYRAHVLATPELLAALPELVGKRLGCWCKRKGDEPCHGDVLVALLRERGLEASDV